MYNWLNFIDYINTMLIISLSELLRFTFNPFGVGTSGGHFPQVAPVAIHIQPLQGWGLFDIIAFPRFFLKAIHIQPLRGWRVDKLSTKSVVIIKFFQGVIDSTPLNIVKARERFPIHKTMARVWKLI